MTDIPITPEEMARPWFVVAHIGTQPELMARFKDAPDLVLQELGCPAETGQRVKEIFTESGDLPEPHTNVIEDIRGTDEL